MVGSTFHIEKQDKKKQIEENKIEYVRPVFTISLEQLNSKPCYICGSLEGYRDRAGGYDNKGKYHPPTEKEPSEPGDYMRHENIYSRDLGFIAVFECSKCHHLLFFRSHYEEDGNLFESHKK